MDRRQAYEEVRIILKQMMPCPFCGKKPKARAYVDWDYSSYGSIGHHLKIATCCKMFPMGYYHGFWCNEWEKPSFELWRDTIYHHVFKWNSRKNGRKYPMQIPYKEGFELWINSNR